MPQDIFKFTYTSGIPGPHLLIFGAIHGDETCGTYAIHDIATHINEKLLRLKRGTLTMVPVCNQKAFESNTRFFEKNLNRVFKKKRTLNIMKRD